MEGKTLSDPRMIEYLRKTFVPVWLDLDQNERIAKILEVQSVPSTIVLSPEADLLGRLVGYVDVERYQNDLGAALRLQDLIQQANFSASSRE